MFPTMAEFLESLGLIDRLQSQYKANSNTINQLNAKCDALTNKLGQNEWLRDRLISQRGNNKVSQTDMQKMMTWKNEDNITTSKLKQHRNEIKTLQSINSNLVSASSAKRVGKAIKHSNAAIKSVVKQSDDIHTDIDNQAEYKDDLAALTANILSITEDDDGETEEVSEESIREMFAVHRISTLPQVPSTAISVGKRTTSIEHR